MNREELLKEIVELELDMFNHVRTSEPARCKENPETFRSMRSMTHSVLSTETLGSYLSDLHNARDEGRNLLTLKYARIDRQIPPIKENPAIEIIATVEERWMKELAERYSRVIKGGPAFRVYLASELETYSDGTLDLYLRDVLEAEKDGRNLAKERFDWLFERIGYGSIDEAERKASQAELNGGD
ncbi:MAG: DUF4125 family protein [Dehalococcoidia bacterium]